jgi:signal peptidase I
MRRLVWPVALLGAAAGAVLLRRRFVVVSVLGYSMSPAYREGQQVLVGLHRAPSVGSVVLLRAPRRVGDGWQQDGDDWMLKRVAALPGDQVPAPVLPATGLAAGARVPRGQLVVLGDHPGSQDSRSWGLLPGDRVLGVAVRSLN